ncbi:DNA replication/repair protein RecF [Acidocella sp.]|uniref:DNA replication/repair protein RecF n=1 Tax=Acidocella sp. TaxID=50710 RepID=UPI00262CD383|nr:DNA replication/repair protein RecF [Acidocella sp.]MDD2795474.1 DNA replication/repair protein RecF [Acidocella sp.]
MTTHLTRLTLTDFRSYPALRFTPAARICVFTGPNGAGKTNLLEAASLLVPGRGLRGAKFSELARRGPDASATWAVAAQLSGPGGLFEIGTGTVEGAPERRIFILDGAKPRSQSEIAERLAAVWLTPQMDRLFTDSTSGRRKFLDRLVIALEPHHAREIAAFEAAAAQRNRLLAENPDPLWLDGLEDSCARHAVAATAARAALIAQLNATLSSGAAAPFPLVWLGLSCAIAEKLRAAPAVEVEDALRAAYKSARAQDTAQRGASLGPQKADLLITDAATARPAALSSTGQQKSMLIGIVLGHAALIAATRGTAPLLLLDEPLVHLDAAHRAALFAALVSLNVAAWVTGTDIEPFAGLQAACYRVHEGVIAPL